MGVDIAPQPNYPFEFVHANVFDLMLDLDTFDLVHASPPCQYYSTATGKKSKHPDLIEKVRRLLTGRELCDRKRAPSTPQTGSGVVWVHVRLASASTSHIRTGRTVCVGATNMYTRLGRRTPLVGSRQRWRRQAVGRTFFTVCHPLVQIQEF